MTINLQSGKVYSVAIKVHEKKNARINNANDDDNNDDNNDVVC